MNSNSNTLLSNVDKKDIISDQLPVQCLKLPVDW